MNTTISSNLKKTLLLALPVCFGQLGHVMVGVVDSIMVGHYGGDGSSLGALSLAACSLANSLFSVVLVFGIGLAYGVTPLIANADGTKDKNKITAFFRNSIIIGGFSGFMLFVFISLSSSLLRFMDQPKEVVELAIPYFNILGFSLIPLMLFLSLKQFAEGLSFTKQAMFISLIANIINVCLNYLFIFGKFGFKEMGLNGAGWATFLSRVIMFVIMFVYIVKSKHFKDYLDGLKLKLASFKIIREILDISIPIAFQFLFEVGAFAFAAIMMGWLGTNQLAAHQIAISIASITYMMASGISAAATVRVGNALGRKNNMELRNSAFAAFILGLAFMFLCALLFIAFHDYLPFLFNDNIEVVKLASSLIVIAAFFQVSDGVQVIGLGALRGISDVKLPTLITVLAYWVVGLPIAYFLAFILDFGAVGIWYGLLIGLSLAAALMFYRFNYKSKLV